MEETKMGRGMRDGQQDAEPRASSNDTAVTLGTARAEEQAQPRPSAKRSLALPDRYEDLRVLGIGGFGEVHRVFDRMLERVVALKILHPELDADQKLRARFMAEIKLTAALQHLGIVAVHDYGTLHDGRLWFTMSEVRGRTLRDVIEEASVHTGEGRARFSRRRLLDVFQRVCETMAYAHTQGVVHRDLKPDNIMVGEFGQVMVMDWGIARRRDELSEQQTAAFGQRRVKEESSTPLTEIGDVMGTPSYMPPEQAMGEVHRIGPATDVHALGAMLVHILTGHPPRPYLALHGEAAIRSVLEQGEAAPDELVRVCVRAMALAPEQRFASAKELAEEIAIFLDGARRRELGLAALERASLQRSTLEQLRKEVDAMRVQAKQKLVHVRHFDPLEAKVDGWALEDEAEERARLFALQEAEWVSAVQFSLAMDAELLEAHSILADHYRDKLAEAELGRRKEEAVRYEVLLRAHDRGKHAAFLRGDGALTLFAEPKDTQAELYRYELRGRRLVPELIRHFASLPLRAFVLPHGSYLVRLSAPGYRTTSVPVLIERGEHWNGCAPGEMDPFPIPLPREGELGEEDRYVPAGYAWIGGDPEAADSLPRQRIWVDGFTIRQFPVTCGEYLAFLNDERALAFLGTFDNMLEHPAFRRAEAGVWVLRDQEGSPFWHRDCPVIADWLEASAFARWEAARTGRKYRLPNELEREKAARGADGRFYPWGDHPDPAFACVLESHSGEPRRERVDGHPTDESPYGVRGLAGNSRDWCMNVWRLGGPRVEHGRLLLEPSALEDPDFRVIKGGAWGSTQTLSQAAGRFGSPPQARKNFVGFRLCASYGAS